MLVFVLEVLNCVRGFFKLQIKKLISKFVLISADILIVSLLFLKSPITINILNNQLFLNFELTYLPSLKIEFFPNFFVF